MHNIAVHLTFFFIENRLIYFKKVLSSLSNINAKVDLFIYTQKKFEFDYSIYSFNSVFIKIYTFNLFNLNKLFNNIDKVFKPFYLLHRKKTDPFYLTWKHRKFVKKNANIYDYQMYIEDDIDFTNNNFNCFLKYHSICFKNGYNLGFLRYEIDVNNQNFSTDLYNTPNKIIKIENIEFLINDVNPYCAFWIYPKELIKEFIKSKVFKFKFKGYGVREKAAIGWNGLNMKKFKSTIIPLIKSKNNLEIDPNCLVHHIPNTYINNETFCKVKLPIII